MSSKKNTSTKTRLHIRNRNRLPYDLEALIELKPSLNNFIKLNKHGNKSIDFANPIAVKLLNQALLQHYYGINYWEFPDKNLCPPIPGRADYLHYIANLLSETNFGKIPTGDKIKVVDIGVGASCIYPIIGVVEYDWHFIGSDIDENSITSARNIIKQNPVLKNKIECRLQKNPKDTIYGIINREEKFDISICNPPFHASIEDAKKGSERKVKNLSREKSNTPQLNFAGISTELVCDGGEHKFIHNLIRESEKYGKNAFWFTTLVSKQSNLKSIYKALEKLGASKVKTINMGTGNKSTRIVAWTFLTQEEQNNWRKERWA